MAPGADEAADPGLDVGAEEAVYAIYTSGSAGVPKAAVVHHGGIANRFHWMTERFGPAAAQSVMQTTRHMYDSAVWQLFWPLVHGGRTVMPRAGAEADTAYLVDLVRAEGVAMADFVPSVFNSLVPDLVADPASRGKLASLRTLVVGGEQITPETTSADAPARDEVRLINTPEPAPHRPSPTRAFGTTVSGRQGPLDGVDEMIGLFINTLPVRMRVPGSAPVGAWLATCSARRARRAATSSRRWCRCRGGARCRAAPRSSKATSSWRTTR
ncbi:MAG: AMP-binding protein [Gemmatimonadetes bacterium]|nr:AMP-binding protein [Gemmatimonadota bacterium]